jgi:hypothetical protein
MYGSSSHALTALATALRESGYNIVLETEHLSASVSESRMRRCREYGGEVYAPSQPVAMVRESRALTIMFMLKISTCSAVA